MDHLTISGPNLAAWLSVFTTSNRPCDGLLFGNVCTTITTQALDTSDALVVEEHEGRIASSYACIHTHSFYSNTGQIEGAKLQQLINSIINSHDSSSSADGSSRQQPQLLGWFSYRPGTPCTPSMREAVVTQSLQHWLHTTSSSSRQQTAPVVFGLITCQPDHNAATISLQYKFYRAKNGSSSSSSSGNSSRVHSSSGSRLKQQPEHPRLQPVELRVYNLGTSHSSVAGGSSSSSTWGAASMPALAAAMQPAGVLPVQQQAQVLSAAAGLSSGVLSAIDGLYASLLDELQAQVAKVTAEQQHLHGLRAANAALQRKMLARMHGATPEAEAAAAVAEGLI